MADTKISALTAATAAASANELAINEAGTSKKLTVAQLLGFIYPIGSIYASIISTNPGTLFGVGTWVAFGAGRVLVGLDSGDTDFDVAEETGGGKTSTPNAHAGTAVGVSGAGSSHNHSHTHGVGTYASPTSGAGASHSHSHQHDSLGGHTHDNHGLTQPTIAWPVGVPTNAAHTHDNHTTAATGSSGASRVSGPVTHSSIAPVISWPVGVPTNSGGATTPTTHTSGGTHQHAADATAEATHTHPGGTLASGVSASDAAAEAAHTHTAGTVTQPNTHAALSVVQPYIIVYMFKRTA